MLLSSGNWTLVTSLLCVPLSLFARENGDFFQVGKLILHLMEASSGQQERDLGSHEAAVCCSVENYVNLGIKVSVDHCRMQDLLMVSR